MTWGLSNLAFILENNQTRQRAEWSPLLQRDVLDELCLLRVIAGYQHHLSIHPKLEKVDHLG